MKRSIFMLLTSLLAVLSFVFVFLFWKNDLLLFFVLAAVASMLLLLKRSKQELKTFIFCAFFGTAAESISIGFGIWSYNNPSYLNVPVWLIVLWGIASIFMARVYEFFKD